MRKLHLGAETAILLSASLLLAFLSNAFAGPARRLSWLPEQPRALPPTAVATAPPPSSAQVQPVRPSAPAGAPAPRTEPRSAVPLQPSNELLARFPALHDRPQADISGEDARWLHRQGALFVDARRSALYAQGHIAGARSISVWEDGLAGKVDQLALFAPDLAAPVVLYCSGGDCQDSHLLAQKLWVAGFRNLRIYADGFPDWEKRGLPIAKGETP